MEVFYRNHIQQLLTDRNSLEKTLKKTANIRLASIFLGLFLLFQAFAFSVYSGAAFLIVFLGGFYYLVKFYEKTEDLLNANFNKEKLLLNEINTLENHGKNVYYDGQESKDASHIFSEDLDLFGNKSLFHLINRAKTNLGIGLLKHNIVNLISDKTVIYAKQTAVKELADKTDWRLNFQSSLFGIHNSDINYSEVLSKLESPPSLKYHQLINWYGKVLPFLWLGVFVYSFTNKFEYFGYMFGAIFFVNFYLGGLNRKRTEGYLNTLSLSGKILKSYSAASFLIANQKFESDILKKALADFPSSVLNSKNPIDDFSVILKKLDIRKNMLAAIFMTIARPFEPIEIIKLGEWLSLNRDFFKRIFKTIGEVEYYCSLATLAFNNKTWVFPEFDVTEGQYIQTTQIGHPLIRGHKTVCNDFELSTKNKLNLITGSNMSGKSTFLRTLGINIVLSNLGGVVFAQKLVLSPSLVPICYMRITDNLNQNASTFKAEIERIKLVLAALSQNQNNLFLIDEMLRGTNSEDKLTGSMALLEKIVAENALAFIATHDLRLTDISLKYPESVKNYYFEYSSENGELMFDYLIKDGVCNSFNASLLLASIGLDMSNKIV